MPLSELLRAHTQTLRVVTQELDAKDRTLKGLSSRIAAVTAQNSELIHRRIPQPIHKTLPEGNLKRECMQSDISCIFGIYCLLVVDCFQNARWWREDLPVPFRMSFHVPTYPIIRGFSPARVSREACMT